MIRRVGENLVKGVDYIQRPGVYAILPVRHRLLLTHQMEHPISALHREVMEETGWTIQKPVRMGAFRRFVFMPEYDFWAEKVCTIFLAKPVMRLGDPTENGHTDHLVPIKLAPEIVENPGDKSFILHFLKNTVR